MQGEGRETIGLRYATAALVDPGVYRWLPVHLSRWHAVSIQQSFTLDLLIKKQALLFPSF